MKKLSMLVLAWLLMWSMALPIAAKSGNVIYDGEAQEFIFAPGSDFSPTDLFPEFKDVMPGDRITQDIVVKNTTSEDVDVKIYMRALGAHEDSVDFLSQLRLLVVKKQDGAVLFDGAASEEAQLESWVCLGTFPSDSEVELSVTLEVPVELDNTYSSQIGKLDWEFMVEELSKDSDSDTVDPGGSELPPMGDSDETDHPLTGDHMHPGIWLGMLIGSGILLGLLWFILFRKDRKKK